MTEPRPIGMRIPRPYATEEEFIQGDGLAIGRMGMILIGAPARPPGIVVRFELLLRDGEPVFRGEGKVVAHRVHSNGRAGLEVRFTRLDKHSKALVERVLELRKAGAIAAAPAAAVPDLAESTAEPARAALSSQPDRASQPEVASSLDRASQPEVASSLDRASQPEVASSLDRASQPEVASSVDRPSQPEVVASPEPPPRPAAPAASVAIAEPEAPDATVVDTQVAAVEAAALAADRHDEHLAVEPEPPVDEAPTPYMPPVSFDDHATGETAEAPRAASRRDDADSNVVQRLRARSARFDAPADTHAALGRLRARMHA